MGGPVARVGVPISISVIEKEMIYPAGVVGTAMLDDEQVTTKLKNDK